MTEINQTQCDRCNNIANRDGLAGWIRLLDASRPHIDLCCWQCVRGYAQEVLDHKRPADRS